MTPDGKPENLYELCEGVCEAIGQRSDNYYQGAYSIEAPVIHACKGTGKQKEVCGTAFCRAGWMVALLEKPKSHAEWRDSHISAKAEDMLRKAGVSIDEVEDLFAGGACAGHTFGTPEYAAEGIRGMREFMMRHEEKLRAAPVKVEE